MSVDDIWKQFSCFSQEKICMKCRSLFSGKNKKTVSKLSSAEFAQKMVKVKIGTIIQRKEIIQRKD